MKLVTMRRINGTGGTAVGQHEKIPVPWLEPDVARDCGFYGTVGQQKRNSGQICFLGEVTRVAISI